MAPDAHRIDDVSDAALSAANARFYDALESADLALMTAVWAHSDEASCAHPGRPPLIGWEAIQAS
ncbi:MAG: nuclear transport factor 2 family protein, partial [Acidimicrobiia bacterium]|nr:nuclear transport factor 2 family protein [Acidimicrobiia bacterium]